MKNTTATKKVREKRKGKGRWIKCGKILLHIGPEYIFESSQNKKWKKRKGKERKNGEEVPAGGVSHFA